MVTGPLLLLILLVAILFVILSSARWKLHPFLGLLIASLFVGISSGMELQQILGSINEGFGLILGYIGLIIVLGSMIGVVIEKTQATLTIADVILKIFGKRSPYLAMSLIGAIVSIPVFCDSAYIILSRLNKAIAEKTKASQAIIALSLATGLYTTHTLVPPTPGPIAAAANVGASEYLGTIIIFGLVISVPVLIMAILFSKKLGKSIQLKPDASIIDVSKTVRIHRPVLAFMPIVLPILLIAVASIVKFTGYTGFLSTMLLFIGNPLIALLIGLICCGFLFQRKDISKSLEWSTEAIKLAGPILILTGAGGAFGNVLKSTPLADMLETWIQGNSAGPVLLLLLSFGIAALLKTAQGSSTSSLVITSSIMAPMLISAGMTSGIELSLIVMAIGGGAMTVSHANDSYFWVFSQFSGMKMKDAFRSYSIITGIQGMVVLLITIGLFIILS